MKKLLIFLFVLVNSFAVTAKDNTWKQVNTDDLSIMKLQVMYPVNFLVYTLDEQQLKPLLFNLSENPEDGIVVTLPMPDGNFRDFKVWQTSMMPANLAAKYLDIKTFTAEAVDDHRVTAKLDFTLYGFHAMIFDGENTSFVDPFDRLHDGYYMVHYKRDEVKAVNDRMRCEVKSNDENGPAGENMEITASTLPKLANRTINGYQLKTYRLALAADHQYCQASTGLSTPTIAQALSCMTTTMNRVNGVYEREFSVHMNFCSLEDTVIWTIASGGINGTDPFSAANNNGGTCLGINQTQCDNRVGDANYDIAHIFTTGGGGISSVGVVCNSGNKAQSCTGGPNPVGDGFDIDYVAHEMGHEFGSQHSFNNDNDGSCGGNAVSNYAYEPGSGSTIMAYAGICDPDDLQPHSDPYFAVTSMKQIIAKLVGSENSCAVITPTNNQLVYLPPFSANYTIPYKTPFELTGPTAVDSVADTAITYCWEQYNHGHNGVEFGIQLVQTFNDGPIFRSYNPVYNPTRVFPKVSMVLAGILSNAGTENNEGEKAADTARYLTFRMAVRDILNGNGCLTWPDDTIHLNVVSTGAIGNFAGFAVTSQGTTSISYPVGSAQNVTWNVVGTNVAPVSCDSVNIYLSTDGGLTWPTLIGKYPNTGTASITIPNVANSTTARIKVKGSNNVFFNVNKNDFAITGTTGVAPVEMTAWANNIKVFPVPTNNILNVVLEKDASLQVIVSNAIGQTIWKGEENGRQLTIPVKGWANGVYYVRLSDMVTGQQIVKSFVVE